MPPPQRHSTQPPFIGLRRRGARKSRPGSLPSTWPRPTKKSCARSVRLVEDTYRAEIAELRGRLEKYESQEGAAIATTQTRHSRNSFEFPATNKEMIRAFKRFVSDYVVKSQQEKVRAVAEAEEKVKARYESIISELTRQIDEFKP